MNLEVERGNSCFISEATYRFGFLIGKRWYDKRLYSSNCSECKVIKMNFSKEIKTSVRYCMIWLMHKHQRAYIQKIMRKNHISNTQIEGEKKLCE